MQERRARRRRRATWLRAWALVALAAAWCAAAAAAAEATGGGASTAERVEAGLLGLLGLPRRPRPRRDAPADVPEQMRRLYERARAASSSFAVPAATHSPHAGPANTVRSFLHEESPVDLRFPEHHKFRLWFNVSGLPADETLRAAEVTLQRSAAFAGGAEGEGEGEVQRVLAYDVVRRGRRSRGEEPLLRLIDSREARAGDAGGELRLDVSAAVRRWVREPRANFGVVVAVTSRDGGARAARPRVRLRRAADEAEAAWRAARPLLLLYAEDGRAREARGERRRRAAAARRPHRRKSGHEACRRRPLYVDFAEVGWSDWIVAPVGYDAFYCGGECAFPLADHLNVTNHAVVQTLVNSVNPAAVPRACCVPTQLSAISMLYLDEENKVVLKKYMDMSVVGCGCR